MGNLKGKLEDVRNYILDTYWIHTIKYIHMTCAGEWQQPPGTCSSLVESEQKTKTKTEVNVKGKRPSSIVYEKTE